MSLYATPIIVAMLVFGAALGGAGFARRRAGRRPLADRIDALLPQTQCGQCGYPGCRPYAEALATGAADINQCPPGGDAGIRALARLLRRKPKPLDTSRGVHKGKLAARIDEDVCIGCTLCIQACPVDAIVGAAKLMHTVIADECTGCELCLPPCPVDCIELYPAPPESRWTFGLGAKRIERRKADRARRRFQARQVRLELVRQEKAARRKHKQPPPTATDEDPRKAAIRAAIERTRAKKTAATQKVTPTNDTSTSGGG